MDGAANWDSDGVFTGWTRYNGLGKELRTACRRKTMKKLLAVFCFVALAAGLFADDFGQIKLENKKFVYQGNAYDSLMVAGIEIKASDAAVDVSYIAGSGNGYGFLAIRTKDFAWDINLATVRLITGKPGDKRLFIGW